MDLPPPPTIPEHAPPALVERMEQPSPVTDQCLERVVNHYDVHPLILSLVAQVEGGAVGTAAMNSNDTADLGIMQINTVHLEKLREHGVTRKMLENNGCLNLSVAAWYLRRVTAGISVESPDELFRAIARYHSHTDEPNEVYAQKLMRRYERLMETHGNGS